MEILSESSKFWSSCLRFRYHLQRVPVSWQLHSWNMGYPWLVSGVVPKQGGPGNWGILSPRWVMKKLRQWGGLTWFDTSWLISNMLFCALEYPGSTYGWRRVVRFGRRFSVAKPGFQPSVKNGKNGLCMTVRLNPSLDWCVWRCLKMSEDVWSPGSCCGCKIIYIYIYLYI